MKNYDESVEINHNLNWPYIPDHPYRILIIGGSGSGKTNVLLNLIKHQRPDIDKIYLYVKDPFESKYQLVINGREKIGIKILKILKAFIDYLQTIDDVYENLEDYNPIKSYFKVPKTIRLNAVHYFIIKIPKKENFNKYHQIIHLTLILKIS